jgi:riboflavin kinase
LAERTKIAMVSSTSFFLRELNVEKRVLGFLKKLCMQGNIFSGNGEGAKFIRLPWVEKQIEEKLGFTPFQGTLNVRLCLASIAVRKSLTEAAGIEISPAPGYCRGRLFKAGLQGIGCALVVPEVANYPEDVIEIVAPVNLRGKFNFVDGDSVEIEIKV